jgi:hypothetical protein
MLRSAQVTRADVVLPANLPAVCLHTAKLMLTVECLCALQATPGRPRTRLQTIREEEELAASGASGSGQQVGNLLSVEMQLCM